jgi:poly(3-hydroxybutyrate) depolymerase
MLARMRSRNPVRFGVYLAIFAGVASCSGGSGDRTGGSGSSGSGNAGSGTAGTSSPGAAGTSGGAGTGSTAGTSGGAGAGSTAGTSGGAGTGGASGATGMAGSGAGATGNGGAGAGGTSGGAGTGGGGIEMVDFTKPSPSTGCGKAPDLTGTMSTFSPGGGVSMKVYQKAVSFTAKDGTTKMGEYYISPPDNYAMATPYKISFAMGGFTRSGIDCLYGDCYGLAPAGHKLGAITVFLTQIHPGNLHTPPNPNDGTTVYVSTGWELSNELEDNLAFFKAAKAEVLSKFCVDQNHVFAAGGSSGADMAQYLGCWMGDELRGIASGGGCMPNTIAPAAGTSPQPAPARGAENPDNICLKTLDFKVCKGNVGVVMVHGYKDPHIPWADARLTQAAWVPKNGCGTGATTPMSLDALHTMISATTNKLSCVDAPGCSTDYPVRWCEHSFPGYDGSTHGWPNGDIGTTFGAGQYIWDFWNSLK